MTVLKEGVVDGALNLYFIYKFLRILTTPFASTEAFKLGIIDEKGKILKKKSRLKTIAEKDAYTMMHRLVWKLKRLMEKVPFGKSRLASYAAALWLIKEEKKFDGTDQELQESFLSFLETDWENDALILKENYEGDLDKKTFSNLREGHKKGHLPPHLAKFFDKKGNLKKDAADRIRKGRKERGVKITDRTPDWMFPEEAPPGWEGTVKAMKKKKNIDNPYALAWHMHNKGMKPHIPEEFTGENMQSFKELEEAVLANRDYKYDGKVVKISKKNFRKVHKDFKGTTKGKETMLVLDPKSGGTILVPVQFEEVELDENKNMKNAADEIENWAKLGSKRGLDRDDYFKIVADLRKGKLPTGPRDKRTDTKMISRVLAKYGIKEEVELDEASSKKARNKAADEIEKIADKGGAEAPTLFSLASKLRKGTHSTTGLKLSKQVTSILKDNGIKEEVDLNTYQEMKMSMAAKKKRALWAKTAAGKKSAKKSKIRAKKVRAGSIKIDKAKGRKMAMARKKGGIRDAYEIVSEARNRAKENKPEWETEDSRLS